MQDARVQTFLEVCRTMNYTRAAEALHITQPAVSQHIAFMEREYDAKLFRRDGKRLVLTPAGMMLRNALSTMAHDETLLRERVSALASGTRIELRIGMTLTAGEYIVAAPLAAYLAEHPEVRATVRSASTQELLADLDAGTLDCAFVEGYFDKEPYEWDAYRTERLVCVCAPGKLPRKPLPFEDILGMQLFVREEGSGTREVLERALAARNLSLSSFADTCQVDSLDIIKVFVSEGLGISFLYEAAVEREIEEGALQVVSLQGAPIEHDISFVRLRNSVFTKDAAQLFSELSS